MSTPELLKDLLATIQCLKKELTGSDTEKVKVAQEAYQELLDGFYEEYEDMMAPQQYRAAKDDPDYFLVLIQLAYHDQDQKNVDSDGGQSLPYFNWKLFTQI
jgi:C-terminal processing protease CtpA/Prc